MYGEDKLILMMGGLHIEIAMDNMMGKWLDGSGWVEMIAKSGVSTTGRSEALLKGSHVKRTRYAHEVSFAALSILRYYAFNLISMLLLSSHLRTGLRSVFWIRRLSSTGILSLKWRKYCFDLFDARVSQILQPL